jgi:hypothetical protein
LSELLPIADHSAVLGDAVNIGFVSISMRFDTNGKTMQAITTPNPPKIHECRGSLLHPVEAEEYAIFGHSNAEK